MRKSISAVIVLCLLFSSFTFAETAEKTDKRDYIEEISKISGFEVWKTGKLQFFDFIYNTDGVKYQKLYLNKNKYGTVGYLITSIDDSTLIEFSLGSPELANVDSSKEKQLLSENKKSNASVKLVRDGIISSITYDFETFSEMSTDDLKESEDREVLENSKKLIVKSSLEMSFRSSSQERVLSDVGTVTNSGSEGRPSCTPVAVLNRLHYWDQNGLSHLIYSTDTSDSLYDELYVDCGSFPVYIGGQHGTWPSDLRTVIREFVRRRGSDVSINTIEAPGNSYYSTIKARINAGKPQILLYGSPSDYGQHYVVLNGYSQSLFENMYVIHPVRYPHEYYRNWDYDVDNDHMWLIYELSTY